MLWEHVPDIAVPFPALLSGLAVAAVTIDADWRSQVLAAACIAGAVAYYKLSVVAPHRKGDAAKRDAVLTGLPPLDLNDPGVCGLVHSPKTYRRVAANPRVLAVFHRLRSLRAANPHMFATALTYVEHLLRVAERSCERDAPYLGLLKDKAINALQGFEFCVPREHVDKIGFAVWLRVLDSVLYREAIDPLARVQDVYPLAWDGDAPHMLTGHA